MVRGLRLSSVLFLVALANAAPFLERPARAMSTGDTGVSDNLVSLPSAPGSVDGVTDNARVTPNTGAMSFSVPIDVPRCHRHGARQDAADLRARVRGRRPRRAASRGFRA
jgi:hypothetical protein